ncbi:Gfo/Idh/MocA family oxidoreductase [Phototrophicus methaneseepsis]|uniref:Gfo/Idh/MocA family oxidoreductase n=1 Tax=Phototrophicus methaneseepsis TaxID=2710758 RepID=A0A7S8IG01_9CHLR|nr:Gfo/Idh/MocA family oxidoreductase [Phototrophicus methaneseepsis]QPC84151.1 Gfo/Idh/MocA family oxidoreductase [Phototrophicus methaneseepsis]
MSTLKVGVIGVGGIARVHMPGWAESPHAEVIAGADVNQEAVETWGNLWGVPIRTTSSAELINDPAIDIIDICTPNSYHAPLAIAALEAGKHVICEKPLAATPDEIKAMIAARDKSGKLLMTAQHFRFRGTSKALKAEIDTGVLGDIYHARSWMLRRIAIPARPGFLMKEHSSGGATIDIGVHILDLTLWMMGNPKPVSVSGVARTEIAKIPGAFSAWDNYREVPSDVMDVEEMAAAFVRFENGATLILEVSWMLHHDTPGEDMQMWLYGNKGGAHWPKDEIYTTNYASKQLYNRALQLTKDENEAHAQECMEFAQAIVDGCTSSPVQAEESLAVSQILNAIYESQKTGREVLIADL